MSGARTRRLGLVLRQAPYAQRSARNQLDVALAAAALEMPLELFFLGDSVWQLAASRELGTAGLPAGLRGWAALPDLTQVKFYVPRPCHERFSELGGETIVPVEVLDGPTIAERWRACDLVMSL